MTKARRQSRRANFRLAHYQSAMRNYEQIVAR
jgi:hypothetical protein